MHTMQHKMQLCAFAVLSFVGSKQGSDSMFAGMQQSPLCIGLAHSDELHGRRGIEKGPGGWGRWRPPLHMPPLDKLGWGLPKVAYLLFYCLQCTEAVSALAALQCHCGPLSLHLHVRYSLRDAFPFPQRNVSTMSACLPDIAKHLQADVTMKSMIGILCNYGKFQCHSTTFIL